MKSSNHSKDEDFKYICDLKDLRENEGKRFIINDVDIAVFKINSEVFALSNICPHQHSTAIYDGFIEECNVVCPVHGWMFNLRTGKTPAGTKGLDSYPVKVVDDSVYIKVDKKIWNW